MRVFPRPILCANAVKAVGGGGVVAAHDWASKKWVLEAPATTASLGGNILRWEVETEASLAAVDAKRLCA